MAAYVPPGWPPGVHPPGSEEFEQTAVAWLLDVVPPDYRLHGVLRRHPVALAALARHHLAACVAGAREGYRTARAELGDSLPPGGVEAVLEAYRTEGSRMVETARAVDLVGRALRGEVFTEQLAGTRGSADERAGAGSRGAAGRRGGDGSTAGRGPHTGTGPHTAAGPLTGSAGRREGTSRHAATRRDGAARRGATPAPSR